MHAVIFFGGPKKQGHTAKAVHFLEENLNSAGHSTERIHLPDLNVNGCLGCGACFCDPALPHCVQNDDVPYLLQRMRLADILIYAAPVYAFSFPAQLKAFIDRHFCLVTHPGQPDQSSVIAGKRAALVMTCSDALENNAELIPYIFDRIFLRLQCQITGKYIIASSSAPDFEDRAKKNAETMVKELSK